MAVKMVKELDDDPNAMPNTGFDIDDVILGGKDLPGDWAGNAYTVHVDPSKLDYATYIRVQSTNNELEPVVEAMAQVITSWDIRRKGAPVPTTEEGIKTLPVHLILNLFRRIWNEVLDTGNAEPSSTT